LSMLSGKPFIELFYRTFSDIDKYIIILVMLLIAALSVALEVLMITKLGWTPGQLLCGIRIKDTNTLKNITLMQVAIRSTFKALLLVPGDISEWFLILPILS
ncbi:RDD family protein, partial [Wolbachia endosymbiont of Pentidionis agamae]|uniref:RDD family protein n=1 Tax=Wolbachia endosymbiont of Pentidionis agamae TaxID=3110435 RepID=UPI002FD4EC35